MIQVERLTKIFHDKKRGKIIKVDGGEIKFRLVNNLLKIETRVSKTQEG